MIFSVDCNGLTVTQATFVHCFVDAPARCDVRRGLVPHPPLWLAGEDRIWGLPDGGRFPPDEAMEMDFVALYGRLPEHVLRSWRVTVIDEGHGITIDAPVDVELVLYGGVAASTHGHVTWAGQADYNVDGRVDGADRTRFLERWLIGEADYDCDGVITALDLVSFLSRWEDAVN